MDLGRIELPSKRGNHMLSTCLSLPKIFEHKQDQSHQLMPYPLKFRKSYEEKTQTIPDFTVPLYQNASEQELLSDISFLPLWRK